MKKNILFVINTMGQAGAEKAMVEFMKVLDKDAYAIDLYVMIPRGEMFLQLPKHVQVLNKRMDSRTLLGKAGQRFLLKTIGKALLYRANALTKLPFMIKNIMEQRKRGKVQLEKLFYPILSDGTPKLTKHYDMAIAYLEGAAAYYVGNRVDADKKVGFIHIDYQMAGYTPMIDRNCYDTFDWIYTVSQEVKEKFLGVYPRYSMKTSVFHNIINEKEIKEKAFQGKGFEDDFQGMRILTVGRLHPQKAYPTAIQAMAIIKKANLPIRWYVLGEGNQREELEKLIQEYHVEKDFVLLGAKPNPYPYYKECDLYVHATAFEGKSIAIEEAQVLGKPILASDCTGNREQIISGVDGELVALQAQAIADAIMRLYEQPEVRKQYAKQAGLKQFEYEKDVAHLLQQMR